MAEEIRAHKTSVSFVEAVPAELDAGSDLTLKVKVACVSHCDLRGRPVRIIDDSGAVITAIELLRFDGTVNETDISIVRAPAKPGTCKWTAAFTAREEEEIPHEASSPPFSFSVKPHGTRVAVWDVPSPVVFGTAFRVKIGVQCSAGCDLTGQKIDSPTRTTAIHNRLIAALEGTAPERGGKAKAAAE